MRHLIGIGFMICTVFAATVPNTAMALRTQGTYSGESCFVKVRTGWDCWGCKDYFYYCTKDEGKRSKCDDITCNKDDKAWQYSNDKQTHEISGSYYYCCIDADKTDGKFVKVDSEDSPYFLADDSQQIKDKGLTKNEIIKQKELGNGQTCNEIWKYSVCGDEPILAQGCFEANDCEFGYIMRKQSDGKMKCVQPCGDDQVFESAVSDNCITCPSTQYQGVVYPNQKYKQNGTTAEEKSEFTDTANLLGYCVKCDPDTSFFNKKTKQCVSKETFKQKGKEAMKKCWPCAAKGTGDEGSDKDVNLFKRCLEATDPSDYVKDYCNFYNSSN
ncbi:hypothetical protein HDR66_02390 [bacterium]|nr:hypothetical protein [bacterium]